MSKTKYNPLTAVFSYSIGNILIKAIPFLTLPLFTKIMSTADYGVYTTYLSYESIATILLGFGLSGTIRVAKVEYKERFEDYISSILFLQVLIAFLLDILIMIAFFLWGRDSWLDSKLLLILLINTLASQVFNIACAKFAINGEVYRNLFFSFLVTIVNVTASLFLCKVVFSNRTYLGRIIGSCLGFFISACIIFVFQLLRSRKVLNRAYWKFGLYMGAPLILHALSLTLLAESDKIKIQAIVGVSEAGIYGIVVTLCGIVMVMITSVDNAWAPWFFSKLGERDSESILKYDNIMIIVFTSMTLVIMLISPELVHLFSSADYWDSIYSFIPLLISVVLNFYYIIPVNFEYFHKKTGFIAKSTVIVAIINLVLNFMLIQIIGYIGAAYATAISKFVLFLMHWRKAWALEHVKLLGSETIVFCLSMLIGAGLVTYFFVKLILVRYIALFVYIVWFVVWCNNQGLLQIFLNFVNKRITHNK